MSAPSVFFGLIKGKMPLEFRFTIPTARLWEAALRPYGGIQALLMRSNSLEVTIITTHHALLWNQPKLTEEKVVHMIEAFVDNGGDMKDLNAAITKAMNLSGVYGKPDPESDSTTEGEGSDDPLDATATTQT